MARSAQRIWKCIAIVIYILFAVSPVDCGLTLVVKRQFAETELGYPVDNDIFLIKNGVPHPVFGNAKLFNKATRPLSSGVKRVEMTWMAETHSERYSLRVTSSDLKVMSEPKISPIPLQGTVQESKAFEITLPCTGLVHESVNVKFVLNYTNYDHNTRRSSKRTLAFSVAKRCTITGSIDKGGTTKATTTKHVNRTVVVTVSAALACVVCVCILVVFFWRLVKRIKKKFGFDEVTERLSPLTNVTCHSSNRSTATSQLPTVVYSPTRDRSANNFFTKIVKRESKSKQQCCPICPPNINSNHSSHFNGKQEQRSVDPTKSPSGHRVGCNSQERKLFSEISVEDDVFVSEQCDVSLIGNEHSSSTLTLAKESDNKKQMYSTLNEYWATKLEGTLKSRDEVEICTEVLGEGMFGRVYKGKMVSDREAYTTTSCVDVAVKVCLDDIEFEQMITCVNEAILMKTLGHENLLNLLGVILQPSSPPLILTPLLAHGDLHKFLRHSRGIGIRRQLIGSRQLVNFATQIARGMEYLSSQKVVHRDLATRNCFVDQDLNVKIGDFALARKMHQFGLHKVEHPTQLAVKWLALESLLYYIFTEKSDIWSFGIVLWELVTLGSQPYAGLDNHEVTPYLETGKRLSRPLRCPDDLYAIMYSCWLASPDDRPTFSIMVHKLEDYELRLRPSCIAFEFDEDTIEMTDDCDVF